MQFTQLVAAAAALATAQAQYIGFNYGSTFTDGSAKQQSDFEAEFNKAKSLAGTNGEFTSARLYTMIQGGTANTPISAIPAAIDTQTSLLLGLWASAGQADFTNEITALTSAIDQYGSDFTSLIAGISVGSEDLYRNSPTGILNNGYNGGADPSVIVDFIGQVRDAIAGTAASGASVGHVDTWTAYVNGSNAAVISACDWLGMDAYPYFQTTIDNGIEVANSTFYEAYDNTVAVSQGKPVWVTETGWPVSGPVANQAVASIDNAETYWSETGCSLFGNINTWWYVLQDALPTTPSPSFGIITDINNPPLYNLTCSQFAAPAASSSSSASSSATSTASSASMPASSAGPNTESLSNAAPGTLASPTSATISQTTVTSATATAASSAASAPVASASSVQSAASSGAVSSGVSTPVTSAASTFTAPAPMQYSSASTETSEMTASAPVTSAASTFTAPAPMQYSSASTETSEMTTASSTTVVGGNTYTVFSTTLLTVTNCPGDCTSTAYGYNATQSVPAPTSTAIISSAAIGTASPSPAASSATTAAAPSGTNCPANLEGAYEYPHLIVPVNKDEPSTAYGTQYNGTISPSISTIFNFDLPASYAGKTCSLVFLFPEQAALETSAYTFNGQGGINVSELSGPATSETTYANAPKAAVESLGSVENVQPGNSYVVASHECNAGAVQSFEFSSTGGLDLEYFQDYNPSPIGAYITVC